MVGRTCERCEFKPQVEEQEVMTMTHVYSNIQCL